MSRKRLFNLMALGTGVAVLAGIVVEIGWDRIATHLQEVGVGFLVLVAIFSVVLTLEVCAWRTGLGPGVPWVHLVGAALAGAAVNALTPLGEGGEVVKANLASDHVPGHRAVSSLLMWNLLFRLAKHLLIFAGPVLLFVEGSARFETRVLAWFFVAAVVASIPTALYFMALRAGGAEWTVRFLRRIPFLRRRVGDDLLDQARSTDRLVRQFSRERLGATVAMALLLLAARLVSVLEVHVVLRLLGAGTSFIEAMFLASATTVVRVFLSVSPVAIGVGEGGETAVFLILGLPADIGFSQAFVRLLRQLCFNVVGLAWLAARSAAHSVPRKSATPTGSSGSRPLSQVAGEER